MEAYVQAALDRNLEELGFLAHVESGVSWREPTWLSPAELDIYWAEGSELARRYADRIRVSLGVEVGVNPAAMGELRQLIGRHRWERVGLSYHYLMRPDEEASFNICSRREASGGAFDEAAVVELNRRYFRELRRAVAELRPAFVCHLDVPRRYLEDVTAHPEVAPLVRELLGAMVECDTAVEINTAGYVHRPGGKAHAYPAPWILTEAFRLGLDVVFCSDSHQPSEVARHFEDAITDCQQALRDSG